MCRWGLCRARLPNESDNLWLRAATSSSIATASLPKCRRLRRAARSLAAPPCNAPRGRWRRVARPKPSILRLHGPNLQSWCPVAPAPRQDDEMTDAPAFTEDIANDRGSDEPLLIVDVEGFEGPLDLLLTMARQQKVDLAKISILALADQYLAFVEHARRMRLELAADYLVMAAWLAYLKSRLLLPEPVAPEGLSAADMAKALALRLRRLDAIREAGTRLFERPQLGRDVFGRGDPEPIAEIKRPQWSATLYDLISSYARERQRHALRRVRFAKRKVWSLVEAREALQRLVGATGDWSRLDEYLLAFVVEPSMRATVFASSLAASLELVREGALEMQQARAFAPIYLRKRGAAEPAGSPSPSSPDSSPFPPPLAGEGGA